MAWGGVREGAGRPRRDIDGEPRKHYSIYCTATEIRLIREALKKYRKRRGTTNKAEGMEIHENE